MAFLLIVTTVSAVEMCGEGMTINTNCRMLTPELTCNTYNYEIFNTTGTLVSKDVLTQLNDTIYFINFTESRGDYIIKLCDGTTREVKVIGDDSMFNILTAIFLFTILFVWAMALFLPQRHFLIKFICFVIGFILIFRFIGFGFVVINELSLSAVTKSSLLSFYKIFGTLMYVFSIYGFVRFLIMLYTDWRKVMEQKQTREDVNEEWGRW